MTKRSIEPGAYPKAEEERGGGGKACLTWVLAVIACIFSGFCLGAFPLYCACESVCKYMYNAICDQE